MPYVTEHIIYGMLIGIPNLGVPHWEKTGVSGGADERQSSERSVGAVPGPAPGPERGFTPQRKDALNRL